YFLPVLFQSYRLASPGRSTASPLFSRVVPKLESLPYPKRPPKPHSPDSVKCARPEGAAPVHPRQPELFRHALAPQPKKSTPAPDGQFQSWPAKRRQKWFLVRVGSRLRSSLGVASQFHRQWPSQVPFPCQLPSW